MGKYDVFIGNVTDVSEETDAAIFCAVSTTPSTKNAEKISNHTKIIYALLSFLRLFTDV